MTDQHVRCYDYVNHPYAAVCAVLARDAAGVFERATQLHAKVGPLDVSAEISIRVIGIEEGRSPFNGPSTRVSIVWEAKHRPGLFPTMQAVLAVYPLTATETQLELEGSYAPPLGLLGEAIDATIGHRVAAASVHRFVAQIASSLRATL